MPKTLTASALGFMMIISLGACSTNQPIQEIAISTKPVNKPELVLPKVDQINIRNVEWVVLNEDNIDDELEKIRATGQPVGLFALTGKGYQNLALNFSDIRAMVQQQQQIIAAYEKYYVEAEKTMDSAVKVQ
jgi:hypothetical protein